MKKTASILLNLPADLKRKLEFLAAKERRSVTAQVVYILERHIAPPVAAPEPTTHEYATENGK